MADGFSSANPALARGPQVSAKPKRRSSGSSGGMSTISTPTPSASEL